jgi:hypothetical protein
MKKTTYLFFGYCHWNCGIRPGTRGKENMTSEYYLKNMLKVLVVILLLSSCSTISYVPKVTLDISPKTINKSVQIERLKDLSPIEDRVNPFMGTSVTNEGSLPGGLELEVTNEIISDFANNGVFSKIGRKIDNPDYIIKGEIRLFYGKSQVNTFFKVSWILAMATVIIAPIVEEPAVLIGAIPFLTCYLGVPVSKNTSEVEIELQIFNAESKLIGTYTGIGSEGISTNMYKNKALAIPSMTNQVFSKAVQQIRDQIIQDFEKFK